MIDIQYIKNNVEKVKKAALNKNRKADIDGILKLDEKRRELIKEAQNLREKRNEISKQNPPTKEIIEEGKKIKESLKNIENNLTTVETELKNLMLYVPNVPLDEVPVGSDETGNIEIKKWGETPKFDFQIKDHIELATSLDLVDFERGNKVSGFRGYFLKNEGAVLHMALLFYVFQKLIKKGYTPVIAPSIIKGFTLFGSGHFPWGSEQDVYKLNEDDMFLSGTAEIPITAMYSGEILNEKDLPKKFVGFSPCFRKEAGTYGKDTKGLYRLHEFWKIEQVILGENNLDKARSIHEELQKNSEEILQDLNLPYRQLLMCTGDMGEPQLKKYDIETYMPSRNGYGETMSNSIMGDFQARRLNIKYKTKEGKTDFVYTFNNTAVASPRILIAIIENYQQEDGSIKIPEVLQSLTGFKEIKRN
jgi:seryl-tRNA synthetase